VTKPNVVAIGGGHGLAATLRAARRYGGCITAVVATADDGGSSGRLRAALGMPPPGDLRHCITALVDPDSPWATALEHRFEAGELDGHALGNLMIAGLIETGHDIVAAVDEVARVAGAVGRVLPATQELVVLKAYADDGEVTGQVAIERAGAIRRVELVPGDPAPPPDVLAAIEQAQQIVLGPGSLYTSVLAAAIVPAIKHAITENSSATRVYVCNLRQQLPETEGYTAAAHVQALLDHGVDIDVMLCHPHALDAGDTPNGVRTVERAVARRDGLAHDPGQLAGALSDLVG